MKHGAPVHWNHGATKPLPKEKLPQYDGLLIGFRAWSYDDRRVPTMARPWPPPSPPGPVPLRGSFGQLWRQAELHAVCGNGPPGGPDRRANHTAPGKDCHCGIYAYYRLQSGMLIPTTQGVIGIVGCWGDIEEGEYGFRAERARILAFVRPVAYENTLLPWSRDTVAEYNTKVITVARYYDVPIIPWSEAEEWASRRGDLLEHQRYPEPRPPIRLPSPPAWQVRMLMNGDIATFTWSTQFS